MKRLILLRHAKSLSNDAAKDKNRPLNTRGRNDAPRIGSYMHHRRYLPDLVLCSSAKRTTETWELLAPELDATAESQLQDGLYLASAATIQSLVRAVDDKFSVLLVIGHNPGLEECAQTLMRKAVTPNEREMGDELRAKFPTCALAVLDFEVAAWRDVAAASGTLVDFAKPKNLEDD